MNELKTAYPALLVIAGLLGCVVLHWVFGKLGTLAKRKLESRAELLDKPSPWLRKLYVEWTANGIRTFLWVVFLVFSIRLIPTLQDDLAKMQSALQLLLTQSSAWFLEQGLSAIVVLIVTIFLMRFAAAVIRTAFTVYEKRVAVEQGETVQRRSQTLSAIFRGCAQAIIFFVGAMVALQQGGLNITPILASAGIVGLAVGFGAQSLIKDIFAGFMILFEEQYSVGDTIKIGDVTGTVEGLTLRSTRVRGADGALTIFPNGGISTVANLSKDWLRVVFDVEVDYAADLDLAMQTLSEAATQLQEERPGEILEAPVMQGIDKVAGSTLTLRLSFKTVPTKQAEISRELRRRVKRAFDQSGIKVPSKG